MCRESRARAVRHHRQIAVLERAVLTGVDLAFALHDIEGHRLLTLRCNDVSIADEQREQCAAERAACVRNGRIELYLKADTSPLGVK